MHDRTPTPVPTYEGRPLAHPDEPIFDQGLAFDLETLIDRRRVLRLFGYTGLTAGMLALVGCAPAGASPSATAVATASGTAGATASAAAAATPGASAAATASPSAAATAAATGTATCDVIPEETAGPFPGDGTNGPNVLTESGVVRQDITTSVGGASGKAEGVPLTIRLLIQDAGAACAPLANAAVYLWSCDREGRYSMYSQGVTGENYLRGVHQAGADGVVTFTSIFPGCYSGRWPHIHFEVYPSLDAATDAGNVIATSQIALPEDACSVVYSADASYSSSVRNLQRVSLDSDNVFGEDNGAQQLGTVTGSITAGYTVELAVPVRA